MNLKYYVNWLNCRCHSYTFRQGPVPYTRCWRGGGHYHRQIQTTQELRENDFLEYDEDAREYGIKARGARRKGNLPTNWDDKAPSRHGDGWKNYRKTQYKNKKKS